MNGVKKARQVSALFRKVSHNSVLQVECIPIGYTFVFVLETRNLLKFWQLARYLLIKGLRKIISDMKNISKKDLEEAAKGYNKALIYPGPSDREYIRLGIKKKREITKKEKAFIQRDAKYKVLDVRTWIDTLKMVDPDSFPWEDPMETMSYQEYRDKVFPADLQEYFGDGELGNVSERWNGQIRHYHLFSTTLFNHVLCAQVICNLHGKKRMLEFLAVTGMPEQFGKRSALVHPVRLFCNLGLIPHRNCISDYLAVFHDVSSGYDDELPIVLEKCGSADESMSIPEIKEELDKQRAYYEKWIVEPDARCPKFYLTLNKRI